MSAPQVAQKRGFGSASPQARQRPAPGCGSQMCGKGLGLQWWAGVMSAPQVAQKTGALRVSPQ
jgi:hypothetical protein